jgi:tRNA pseudouridine55 synthase
MRGNRKSKGREVHGILLLDKPPGLTSNQALQHVKHLYQARKAGHTGSLDKQASGLLPICFGEAAKFSGYLLESDKYYIATCKLGVVTSTGDTEGKIIDTARVPALTVETVRQVLSGFTGVISQVPPMHSALKHQGQRLYQLAHQGIEVERKPRQITIYTLELLSLDGDEISIRIHCSKGTYIRTLAEDIGKKLGCGAHVKNLQRVGAGPFRAEQMITLERLAQLAAEGLEKLDQQLIAMECAMQNLPEIRVTGTLAYYLGQGQAVVVPHAPVSGLVRLYNEPGSFMGLGEVLDDGRIAPRRLVRMRGGA